MNTWTRIVNFFKAKPTDPPQFERYANVPFTHYRGYGWGRKPGAVDYRGEVGDLDGNSLAMAVVNYTATRIPEARPSVVTQKGDESESDFTHPLASLIRRPNAHHVWANYVLAASMSWWFSGNVYFYKVRDMTGQVIGLWYLPHFMITPRWPDDGKSPEVPVDKNTDKFLSHYQYTIPGRDPVLYPAKDVLHIKRGVDLSNSRLGLGAFEALFKELYGDDRMALFTAAIMRNMGLQVPIFSPKEATVITTEQGEAMKATWIAKTTGERAGEPVINTIPIDVEKFGFNPSELDLSNLRLIPESRVCAVTGIPASTLQFMVGLQNGTSYASSEQARQQGFEEVIVPILRAWEEEISWQLLTDFQDVKDSRFVFDTTEVRVLQEDRDALYKRESEALRAGGQSLNDFLQAIGRKPIGNEGDIYYVPSSARPMTLERILATADGSLAPEPIKPDEAEAANGEELADIDRALAGLEAEMREFMRVHPR